MPIIRTTEGHVKIPSEDTLFGSGGEDGQLSAWHRMTARAGYVPVLLWPMIEWPALEMHLIVIAPGLAKSLSRGSDLWDNLRLTYTLITTNSENRVEQHLTICHQPGHGYHIYLIIIDCLNYLYWLLDLKRTYFNSLSDPDTLTRRATQTREITKDLIDNTTSPLDKTKTLTMARSQATKRVTRKGSKHLTDEERASQVASPTIPPESEGEDNGPGRSPFFTPEVMRGVREAQKKRAKMTPE